MRTANRPRQIIVAEGDKEEIMLLTAALIDAFNLVNQSRPMKRVSVLSAVLSFTASVLAHMATRQELGMGRELLIRSALDTLEVKLRKRLTDE